MPQKRPSADIQSGYRYVWRPGKPDDRTAVRTSDGPGPLGRTLPRSLLKPNLAAANCTGLWFATSFRLGKAVVADYGKIKPKELVRDGMEFKSYYAVGKQYNAIDATLTLAEKFPKNAAERWSLTVQCYQILQKPRVKATRHESFARFMRKLGQAGLEIDAAVNAFFLREPDAPIAPELPSKLEWPGGAFTHVIAYTVARLGELGEILYEVGVRRAPVAPTALNVGFSYRTTLGEGIVQEVLRRAIELMGLFPTRATAQDVPAAQVESESKTAEQTEGGAAVK
jgi:hypothetical protein